MLVYDSSNTKLCKSSQFLKYIFSSTRHPFSIAMKNKAQLLNQKSFQNHKMSQKFKYQGTVRFSV